MGNPSSIVPGAVPFEHALGKMYLHCAMYMFNTALRWRTLLFTSAAGALFVTGARSPCHAHTWGVGSNLVSAYVVRDSTRSGPAVQPSGWAYLPAVRTLLTVWSSVYLRRPRMDSIVLDAKTGIFSGKTGWVGLTARWDWMRPSFSSGSDYSLEIGATGTWFRPPYRPTASFVYDVHRKGGILSVLSIPYTMRIVGMTTATFIPEFGIRIRPRARTLSFQYFSFTALTEQRWGAFTFVPIVSVVPSGAGVGEWILWGGLHLGVVR